MESVKFGKKWQINCYKDLDRAMRTLKENHFVAEMSDSYAVTLNEQAEINRQRADVMRQAREKGIIEW